MRAKEEVGEGTAGTRGVLRREEASRGAGWARDDGFGHLSGGGEEARRLEKDDKERK